MRIGTARARLLGCLLGAAAALAIAVALAWWWIIFRQVVSYDYMTIADAAVCLGRNSTICDLAMSLCGAKHAFGVARYSPTLLWFGIALGCVNFMAMPDGHKRS
jgi:hypothetical protein